MEQEEEWQEGQENEQGSAGERSEISSLQNPVWQAEDWGRLCGEPSSVRASQKKARQTFHKAISQMEEKQTWLAVVDDHVVVVDNHVEVVDDHVEVVAGCFTCSEVGALASAHDIVRLKQATPAEKLTIAR